MNDRPSEPASNAATGAPNADTKRIKANIENTRAEMSATMSALESKLNPTEIREQVGEAVREHLGEAKAMMKEEISEAKRLLDQQVHDVEQRVRQGLVEARDAVKVDVRKAIDGAKRSIRAATLGKAEDLATQAGDIMNDTRDTLFDTVRQNPIPAALAGIGLAWLFMNRSSSSRRARGSYGEYRPYGSAPQGHRTMGDVSERAGAMIHGLGSAVGSAAHHASDTVRQASDATSYVAHRASETANSAAHKASETLSSALEGTSALAHRAEDAASQFADHAATQAKRVEQSLERALHESPLALGAVALASGAALGFALPRTRREDALMGETRDRVVAQAEDAAGNAASALVKATEKSADEAKKALGEGASKAFGESHGQGQGAPQGPRQSPPAGQTSSSPQTQNPQTMHQGRPSPQAQNPSPGQSAQHNNKQQ